MRNPTYIIFFIACAGMLSLTACKSGAKETKPAPPATQRHPVKEAEINTITLTEKAVERLGIETTTVTQQKMANSRIWSGEVIAQPGKGVTITAPVAGTLLPPANGRVILAGQSVQQGELLYRLLILPSERDLISAQEDVAQRKVQYDVTSEKVKRNQALLKDKAGSLRAVQEAEAELAGVAATLRVAEARLELLKGNKNESVADRLSTLEVRAPISGVVQQVYSSPSQIVASAAPVMDIVALNNVWVKVQVYAGDAELINRQATAAVRLLSDFSGSANFAIAQPVKAPQTASSLTNSVDMYYTITNQKSQFRPGQKVSVTLSYQGDQASFTVPFAAIVYDIYGGTWIYENPQPGQYVRRRVELEGVKDGWAQLRRGPAPHTTIVTAGAAELFGIEFGGGK